MRFSVASSRRYAAEAFQIGICLLCATITFRYPAGLEGTEFSGGWLTGRLLHASEVGTVLFVVALALTFPFRRLAAGVALAAALACLPLYLYIVAPGPFRRIAGGEYSVPLQASFVWDPWAISAICLLAVAATISIYGLFAKASPA
jgi:hypothetical protein